MNAHGDDPFVEALARDSPSDSDDDFGVEAWTPPPPTATVASAAAVTAAADAASAPATVTPPPAAAKQGHHTPVLFGAPVGPRRPYPRRPPDPDAQGSPTTGCATATATAAAGACPVDAHDCSSAGCPPSHPAPSLPPAPLWDDRDVRAVERTASAWMRSVLAAGAATAALLRLDGGAPYAAGVAVAAAAAVGAATWRRSVNVAAVCKGEVRPAGWVVWGLAVGGGGLVIAGSLVVGGVMA